MKGKYPRLVYFARRADGAIKIGCSAWPKSRMRQLGLKKNGVVELLATAPGGFTAERNLHLKFAGKHIGREWFLASADLLAVIEETRKTGAIPLAFEECREKIFARRYLAGETLKEIGDDYGISRERVRQVIRRNGVPSLGLREEHKQKAHEMTSVELLAVELYRQDVRPKEIVRRTGLKIHQIRTALERCCVQRKGAGHWNRYPQETIAKVVELYQQGLTAPVIAERTGIAHATYVYRYLKSAGVAPHRQSRRGEIEKQSRAIIAAYLGGYSAREVSEQFGAHQHSIANLLRRHGILTPETARKRQREAVIRANKRRAHNHDERLAA